MPWADKRGVPIYVQSIETVEQQMYCRLSRSLGIAVVVSTILLVGLSGAAVGMAAQEDLNSTETADDLPPHLNPDEIDTAGDLDGLETFLRGELDGQLADSLANMDEGDYERARAVLGEEYEGDLSRYRDLAADLDTEAQAELFGAAQSEQQEFVDAVESYETTREEYEQAREDGDSERARELAREWRLPQTVSTVAVKDSLGRISHSITKLIKTTQNRLEISRTEGQRLEIQANKFPNQSLLLQHCRRPRPSLQCHLLTIFRLLASYELTTATRSTNGRHSL